MGAFLLVNNTLLEKNGYLPRLGKSLEIFSTGKKLQISAQIDFDNFSLFLYRKMFCSSVNFVRFPDRGFIASTGSLVYKGSFGEGAMRKLYDDLSAGEKIENHCRGNYTVIALIKRELLIFRDFMGLYPVYHSADFGLVSSSFLVAASLIGELSISDFELYEYLFNGYWHDRRTLFNEIQLLQNGVIVYPEMRRNAILNPDHEALSGKNYSETVGIIKNSINEHFREITTAFKYIRSGLSGGYDSRLCLASLLHAGAKPSLYVNGTPGSIDMECAVDIAMGLGLPIERIFFFEEYDKADTNAFGFFQNRFYRFDGLGTSGLFDNYSDLEYVLNNPRYDTVILNGAGGEIYREAWNIPNRKINLDAFIRARYGKQDLDLIVQRLSKREYFNGLHEKLALAAGFKNRSLERHEFELLHCIRYKAIHFIISTHQELNSFILPFHEPDLIFQSLEIPMKYKYHSKLNLELIRLIYPALANFRSAYGYSFNKPVPLVYRMADSLLTNIPFSLRPVLKKHRKSRKLPVSKFGTDLLSKEIVGTVIPGRMGFISNYIKTDLITNEAVLSRALTVEYLTRFLRLQ